jgi:hypothetical protein
MLMKMEKIMLLLAAVATIAGAIWSFYILGVGGMS